jgi:hypothetical protein
MWNDGVGDLGDFMRKATVIITLLDVNYLTYNLICSMVFLLVDHSFSGYIFGEEV